MFFYIKDRNIKRWVIAFQTSIKIALDWTESEIIPDELNNIDKNKTLKALKPCTNKKQTPMTIIIKKIYIYKRIFDRICHVINCIFYILRTRSSILSGYWEFFKFIFCTYAISKEIDICFYTGSDLVNVVIFFYITRLKIDSDQYKTAHFHKYIFLYAEILCYKLLWRFRFITKIFVTVSVKLRVSMW